MDRLDAMSILLTVVEAGSLSAAARQLGKPLTTISRKVSELENHLNTRLLIRTSRKLDLTDAGRTYIAACKRILSEVHEAERSAAGEYSKPKGDLVITAPVVFGRWHVLPVIVEFLKEYPDIDIQLVLADRIIHLLDDHVDLAVRIGELPDSRMIAIKLGEVRLVVCGSPGYFSSQGIPAKPDDLSSHTGITFDNMKALDGWSFKTTKSERIVGLRSRLVVNTAEAAIDAAVAGLGVTRVLSYQIAKARRRGLLDVVLREFEPDPLPVNLVYAGRHLLPLKLRAFLDFAKPRLKIAMSLNDK